ncbi:MAG: serine/threonine-protein kinase RsbW [Blastocatellia bacterium]|nr:serine/threonine-protein kinase RsbW [Blastocatellia bacterium]
MITKRRILIVDNSEELRASLPAELGSMGHEVIAIAERAEALVRTDLDDFDVIISDLVEDADFDLADNGTGTGKRKRLFVTLANSKTQLPEPCIVKAFKIAAVNLMADAGDGSDLREIVEKVLAFKLRCADQPEVLAQTHEKIDFELPSDLSLMNGVLQYLLERVSRLGLIQPERSNLFVALDEAFVNAVKHGNKNNPGKLLRITAELSPSEAVFTVEDEGEGFDIQQIPDPTDPANLFKTSGRGVLLIYNIMDEVEYNAQGNLVKMVKRPEEIVR